MYDPEHAMTSIRAILALCCWPLPMNSTFKDPSHAMSGTALQLAIQKGLPFAYRKQDFVRVPLERSEKDRMFRSRLWTFCQMVVQRYVQLGLISNYCIDTYKNQSERRLTLPFNIGDCTAQLGGVSI